MRQVVVWLLALAVPALAGAAQEPVDLAPQSNPLGPMPGETRLVSFVYDRNDTYPILTMPGAVTDIELRKSEQLVALALGDGVQWTAQKKDNHVFLRPMRAGLFTSGTLVTNERTYQLTLRSSPPGGKWYQRVSWEHPDLVVLEEQRRVLAAAAATEAAAAKKADPRKPAPDVVRGGVRVDQLNFGYNIEGDAPFRPDQVFDDGTFTYVRFGKRPQELPALFVRVDGEFALANYTFEPENPATRAPTIKVHRLFDKAALRLGDDEIEIIATRRR